MNTKLTNIQSCKPTAQQALGQTAASASHAYGSLLLLAGNEQDTPLLTKDTPVAS